MKVRAEKKQRAMARKQQTATQKQQMAAQKQLEKKALRAQKAEQKTLRKKERDKLIAARNKLKAERLKRRMVFYSKIKSKLKNRKDGFDYDNFGILPRVELIVNGDMTSVAMRLGKGGITALDVIGDGKNTRVKLRKKDLRKAIAILDEMCYTYTVGAMYGMGRRLRFCLSRCGLFIGAALSVACLNIFYGYIWRIEVDGTERLSVAAVESVLKRSNISVGSKKSSIGFSGVVTALEDMDGVADASCEVVGTTLRIRILESKDFTVHEQCDAYVSDYDATVTRIVMRSGNALVKRGDVVKRGEMLANGDVYSTTGELLYTGKCEGEVYGDVSVTYSADISATTVEYRRTGRVTTRTVFGLFGHSMGSAKSPYSAYETTSHTASYDVLLPLYVTTYKFYEIAPVEVERDATEVAELFAAQKIDEMSFAGDFKYSYNIGEPIGGLIPVHLFLSGEAVISRGESLAQQT